MAEPFIGPGQDASARPVAEMSFEEALSELEGIVQKLERGQLDLESSIQAYERGTALRQHCAGKLKEVQLRVDKLTQDRNGDPKLTPFEET
jgi:exodeoxyribonuclease VII small subunit